MMRGRTTKRISNQQRKHKKNKKAMSTQNPRSLNTDMIPRHKRINSAAHFAASLRFSARGVMRRIRIPFPISWRQTIAAGIQLAMMTNIHRQSPKWNNGSIRNPNPAAVPLVPIMNEIAFRIPPAYPRRVLCQLYNRQTYFSAPFAVRICLSIVSFFHRFHVTEISLFELSNLRLSRSKNSRTWSSKHTMRSQSSSRSSLKGFG